VERTRSRGVVRTLAREKLQGVERKRTNTENSEGNKGGKITVQDGALRGRTNRNTRDADFGGGQAGEKRNRTVQNTARGTQAFSREERNLQTSCWGGEKRGVEPELEKKETEDGKRSAHAEGGKGESGWIGELKGMSIRAQVSKRRLGPRKKHKSPVRLRKKLRSKALLVASINRRSSYPGPEGVERNRVEGTSHTQDCRETLVPKPRVEGTAKKNVRQHKSLKGASPQEESGRTGKKAICEGLQDRKRRELLVIPPL